jgi:hypothetical protein
MIKRGGAGRCVIYRTLYCATARRTLFTSLGLSFSFPFLYPDVLYCKISAPHVNLEPETLASQLVRRNSKAASSREWLNKKISSACNADLGSQQQYIEQKPHGSTFSIQIWPSTSLPMHAAHSTTHNQSTLLPIPAEHTDTTAPIPSPLSLITKTPDGGTASGC